AEVGPEKASEIVKSQRESVERYVAELAALRAPKLFVGMTPYLIVIVLLALAVVGAQWLYGPPLPPGGGIGNIEPQFKPIGIAAGGMLVLVLGFGTFLWFLRRRQIHSIYTPLRVALTTARRAAEIESENQSKSRHTKLAAAT